AHEAGALLVSATTEALALAALRSPGSCGADIAVAEGQSFGLPMSYGGPGVGLFACQECHVRAMPGRVVGETVDGEGRRGYVLTLATREQHIRRERATSNICTNQGLCALAVTVHLSMLGRHGLQRLARVNAAPRPPTASRGGAARVGGRLFDSGWGAGPPAAAAQWEDLARRSGVVAGFPLGRWYQELDDTLLHCVTETHQKEQVDRLIAALTPGARTRRTSVA